MGEAIHICGESNLTCRVCGSQAKWVDSDGSLCNDHYQVLQQTTAQLPTYLSHDDIQALAECALRYALRRQTYITSVISEAIRHIPAQMLSPRSIAVMRRDLRRYFAERKENPCDDECDYESWKLLDEHLKTLDNTPEEPYN